jgi:hypothetical protein
VNKQDPHFSWQNPASWKLRFVYFCKEDPRIIVPKRFGFGYTLNFARPFAVPALIVMILPILLLRTFLFQQVRSTAYLVCVISYVVGLFFLCRYIASDKRIGE